MVRSPEVVFKAITDPKELTNWFPDNPIFDARIGGKIKFFFHKEKQKDLDRDTFQKAQSRNLFQIKKYLIPGSLKIPPKFRKLL
jgi:Activator of Hsp90 ATPase homolog 1-like protein